MFGKDAATILKTVKEIYDEHIVVKTRFESLRDTTKDALAEYRRLNERLIDKLETQEKERAKTEAELRAKIASLEARLDAFSEKAMRAAVADVAEKYLRRSYGDVPLLTDGAPPADTASPSSD